MFAISQGINIEYKNLKHDQNELDDFLSILFHTWNATKKRVIRIRNVTCFVASPMLSDCTWINIFKRGEADFNQVEG